MVAPFHQTDRSSGELETVYCSIYRFSPYIFRIHVRLRINGPGSEHYRVEGDRKQIQTLLMQSRLKWHHDVELV